jgi:tRNA-dihydrouridine synthase A
MKKPEQTCVPDHAYSVAPMMEVTDRHFRTLARLISRRATLYTEMVVDRTLIHNPVARERELRIPPIPQGRDGRTTCQHPVVLQLGGSVPEELEAGARIAAAYGYTEVNLNCGCPSPKVAGKGCFGAALMRTPETVAEATNRMAAVLPPTTRVTVKCRIGVDDDDSYDSLHRFVRIISERGPVSHFIVHARKAILGGLSPAANRTVPPLKPDYVYRLREDFPQLTFSINGGLRSVTHVATELRKGVHGVMVGRGVMDNPWEALCDVDMVIYGEDPRVVNGEPLTRRNVVRRYLEYAEVEMDASGAPVRALIRPLLNLFTGEPNGKRFRRSLDQGLQNKGKRVAEVVLQALRVLSDDVLDRLPPSLQPSADGSTTSIVSYPRDEMSQELSSTPPAPPFSSAETCAVSL